VGEAGDGPGEFQGLVSLSVAPGDTVYAFDRAAFRVSVYRPDGTFERSFPLRPDFAGPGTLLLDAAVLDGDRLLLAGVGPGEAGVPRDPPHRVTRDRVLGLFSIRQAELGPARWFGGELLIRGAFGEVRSPFSNRPFVSVSGGRVIYGSGDEYDLTVWDGESGSARVVRWAGWGSR
jgi:hypothetical protein